MNAKRVFRKTAVWMAAAGLAASLTACGGSDDGGDAGSGSVAQTEKVTLRLGVFGKSAVWLAYYAAIELGYLDDENVAIEETALNDEPGCLRAVVGGSLDACFVGADTVLRSDQSGAKVRIVATMAGPTVNPLNVDPKKIKTWADLKGQSISVQTPDAGSSVAIRALLASHGIEPSDVTLLGVGGSSKRYAALTAHKVAAAVTTQPLQFQAEEEGYPVLGTSLEAGQISNYLAAIPQGSAKHDAALERFVKAISRAQAWLADPANKAEALKLSAKQLEIDDKYAAQTYELLVEQGHFTAKGVGIDLADVDRILGLTAKYSDVKLDRKAADISDSQYVKAAG